MNKREPFELQYFKLLPQNIKDRVEKFVDKLELPHKDFVYKRYVENKPIRVIAEEMGYEERTLYKYRNEIIDLWERFFDDQFTHHRERILAALRRHGSMEYSKLLKNMNLRRSGLSLIEFKEILRTLVASREIVCIYEQTSHTGSRKIIYAISGFVRNSSQSDIEDGIMGVEFAKVSSGTN